MATHPGCPCSSTSRRTGRYRDLFGAQRRISTGPIAQRARSGMTGRSDRLADRRWAAEDPASRSPVKPQQTTTAPALSAVNCCIDDRAGWLCDRLAAAPRSGRTGQGRAL